jgi:signal peptidase II
MPYTVPYLMAALLVALDQASKAWVVAHVPLGERVASWGLLHLTHTRNTGAAFGLARDTTLTLGEFTIGGVQLLGALSLLVAAFLIVWLWRQRGASAFTRASVALILAGALGNGIDRWRLGYVVDFIHPQAGAFNFAVFNVADAAISVGAALLLLSALRHGSPAKSVVDR